MGTIKDRIRVDLTEAEDINKRWQEDTEELYKKDLRDPDDHEGVITHLQPDILECEVKWALGSITMNKASEGDGLPVELFQILKTMLWKYCTQYASKSVKFSSGHRTGKRQLSFQSQSKAVPKNVQNTTQLHSSHMLAKQCSKFSKPGFNSICIMNFQMFKLDLEQAEEPEIKLPTSVEPSNKQETSRKTSTSALLTTPKPLTVWITTNCEKFWKRWEYWTTWPAAGEEATVKLDRNNRLVPNRERSTSRLYIVTLLIQLLCKVHHAKCWAGWTTNWNQDCWEKYQ